MESGEALFRSAMLLKPQERSQLIDGLLRSLDEPDVEIDAIWAEEAQKRLRAHQSGESQGVPITDVFPDAP